MRRLKRKSPGALGLLALVAAVGTMAPDAGRAASEPAAASPWVHLHASRARLVGSEAKGPGGVRLAGLEIAMDDGWKTYWRMPGDAGVPPQHEWGGSTNVAGVKVLYPAPMRMPEAGGEVIGYKHAVLFPIEVTPEDPAKPVVLKLALEFGVCREICVPATAAFTLALPPTGAPAQRDAIAAAVERVPRPHAGRQPADPELKGVSVDAAGAGARLTARAAFGGDRKGDVFVEAPEGLYVPMLRKEAPSADGTVGFTADLSADLARDLKGKTLTFTLVSESGASEAQWTFP